MLFSVDKKAMVTLTRSVGSTANHILATRLGLPECLADMTLPQLTTWAMNKLYPVQILSDRVLDPAVLVVQWGDETSHNLTQVHCGSLA